MNFFEQQDIARRKTFWLVLLFIPAVISAVISVVVMADIAIGLGYYLGYFMLDAFIGQGPHVILQYPSRVPPAVLLGGAAITLIVILWQTLSTMRELRDGGSAIAYAFNARWVNPDSQDLKERRLLNVVEEMAIASGVRVPDVFILEDERGLNACAAGNSASDAIVVVTRGLLDNFSRDELQGVIGHEFSHILNGDMALNMRMMGILAGIIFIGSIGESLVRNSILNLTDDTTYAGRYTTDAGPLSLVVGPVMVFIGFTGVFFSRLIKAAVSREREYLADAASVQFTRNTEGLVSALEKMRTAKAGTLIRNRYAEEASHMFFGPSIRPWMAGLLASHPPLIKRLKRIMPNYSALAFNARKRIAARAAEAGARPQSGNQPRPAPLPLDFPGTPGAAVIAGLTDDDARRTGKARVAVKMPSGRMTDLAGAADEVETIQRQLAALPDGLRERVHQADEACATVLALMLATNDEVRSAQLAAIDAAGMKALAEASAVLEPITCQVAPAMRFPLIDLALPAIKHATPELRAGFLKALEGVVKADRRLSPHEFVVLTLMQFQAGDIPHTHAVKYKSLDDVHEDALWLLTLVAYAGCVATAAEARQEEFKTAFAAGVQQMKLKGATPAARDSFTPKTAVEVLGRLRLLSPLKKSLLIQGLFASVMADNTIRVIEAELMRMVGAVLDCPLPPLVEDFDDGNTVN